MKDVGLNQSQQEEFISVFALLNPQLICSLDVYYV